MNGLRWVVIPSGRFRRAYRRYIGSDLERLARVEAALDRPRLDPFDPKRKTHSLRGHLLGCWACSCGYDCRTIFTIEPGDQPGQQLILLQDIGTHEDVY
ncbi:MAG: type II toxin-antitoxin system mRNA interferase toxin, RelE/StbE family [Verrucomicrobia bacterium]|nr:type II toxin-antitoxin system mRNA interferase toxin, RelE/StbE family [Verrucomicrobiota bacterium]